MGEGDPCARRLVPVNDRAATQGKVAAYQPERLGFTPRADSRSGAGSKAGLETFETGAEQS